MLTAIRTTYSVSDAYAAEVLRAVPFVHVGTLAQLPGLAALAETRTYARDYSPTVDETSVRAAQQFIKIIHEDDLDSTKELEAARGMIREARAVLFLGFGYHKRNVERLKLFEKLREKAEIFGTVGEEFTTSELQAGVKPLFASLGKRCRLFRDTQYADTLQFLKHHRHIFLAPSA